MYDVLVASILGSAPNLETVRKTAERIARIDHQRKQDIEAVSLRQMPSRLSRYLFLLFALPSLWVVFLLPAFPADSIGWAWYVSAAIVILGYIVGGALIEATLDGPYSLHAVRYWLVASLYAALGIGLLVGGFMMREYWYPHFTRLYG